MRSERLVPASDILPCASATVIDFNYRAILSAKQKSVLFNYAGLMIHFSAVIYPIARNVTLLLSALKGGHLN